MPVPASPLSHLQLALSLACLASLGNTPSGVPWGMAWTLLTMKCQGFSYLQPSWLSSALVYLPLLRSSTWMSLVCFSLISHPSFHPSQTRSFSHSRHHCLLSCPSLKLWGYSSPAHSSVFPTSSHPMSCQVLLAWPPT